MEINFGICLASEESSNAEPERSEASKFMLCDHRNQLVSRRTFHCHQSEQLQDIGAVDLEE